MTENEIAKIIVDACYEIHSTLGPGLLETVYEAILQRELQNRGLQAVRQSPVAIHWKGVEFAEGFRADLIVNDLVIIELNRLNVLLLFMQSNC